ncbi:hypothetical protein [Parasphingorhabdus sp.]
MAYRKFFASCQGFCRRGSGIAEDIPFLQDIASADDIMRGPDPLRNAYPA